ncbi:zinc ABC transporter substrate-binding protein [Cytobacillus sp. S13-E01]|uniref:metal ABC transporter solute-binding protein, Zn/Mn family n=1 Tax=Cytobacillus sp. S13-E01 TaxID=3031326 RepID=UPI0023D7BA6B|nr:zinc ABC transporter substrate-binding protein [Cytobacillus sp. S13-E01]MDF0727661.1 zinc ABC transporter substrate-binding protein [Cytobacillus sp. S13-E01]
MKMKILTPIFLILTFLALSACSNNVNLNKNSQNKDTRTIYTTIYPLQYFAERIGGGNINVELIIPSGSDAHTFEPTTKTMVSLAESDAFIYTGTGLEGFANSIIDAVKNEDVLIVNATNNVDIIKAKETENDAEEDSEEHEEETDRDPHFWLEPKRSISAALNIKNALVQLIPDQKEEIEKNFNSLKMDLEQVDSEFINMVNNAQNKNFLVSHSAYGYWEDSYGLKQIGISGLSPSDEPSQKQLIDLINLVKENNITYIFFEENSTTKIAETVQRETGTKILTLYNLESISDQNRSNNEDYISLMKKNIQALKQGLN